MAETVREVMTPQPTTVSRGTSVFEAAQLMREEDIGDVLVLDETGHLLGILTDRDIVVRCVADQRDPMTAKVGEIASEELVTVSPEDGLDLAAELMREHAVRRLPVVREGYPVGIISLGDLALEQDPKSVLEGISTAPANV